MRVYLATTGEMYSAKRKRPRLRCRMNHQLITYDSASRDLARYARALENGGNPTDYCVDSGAHVWLSSFFKTGTKAPVERVEKIAGELAALLRQLPKPTFVVELDLQRIYGLDTIHAWRRDIWAPLAQELSCPVAYVWHPGDGEAEWDALLDDPAVRYLGFSGNARIPLELRARLVHRAYDAGKPVHGFACVRAAWLQHVPFFSVDSTSWAAGSFMGTVPSFNTASGAVTQHPVGRRAFTSDARRAATALVRAKGRVLASMVSSYETEKTDFSNYYQHAVDTYARLQQWWTRYWVHRGVDWERRLGLV